MKAHVIEAGKIANTVVVESLNAIPGKRLVTVCGNIGDLYDEKTGKASPDPAKTAEQEKYEKEHELLRTHKEAFESSNFFKDVAEKNPEDVNAKIDEYATGLDGLREIVKDLIEMNLYLLKKIGV